MTETQVKLSSVTNATRAKRILVNNGFRAYIIRSSELEKGNGCGYSVVFSGDAEKGTELLRNSGIRINAVEPL